MSFFAIWSVKIEFTLGKGTPAPMMPTQKLIVSGPFLYCRNPMFFGTICAYLGIVIMLGSISALLLFLFFSIGLIVYVKVLEEKELTARFGQDYLEYKAQVPFLIPNFRKYKTKD